MLSSQGVPRCVLQLVAVGCVFLAAKQLEVSNPYTAASSKNPALRVTMISTTSRHVLGRVLFAISIAAIVSPQQLLQSTAVGAPCSNSSKTLADFLVTLLMHEYTQSLPVKAHRLPWKLHVRQQPRI